jgi:hypothetical protein
MNFHARIIAGMTHASGEKCATALFTDTLVGNARPEIIQNLFSTKEMVDDMGWYLCPL